MFRKLVVLLTFCLSVASIGMAQVQQTKGNYVDKFRQMDEIWPTANSYRTAGGEPGHEYWQQRADYKINATLDEKKHRIEGNVEITYHNNSPDTLRFLWVQLDQNRFNKDSMQHKTTTYNAPDSLKGFDGTPARLSLGQLRQQQLMEDREFGFEINTVTQNGSEIKHTIVGTKMRVDLPMPLRSGESTTFAVDYAFNIIESDVMGGRGGYEHFPDDEIEGGGYLYEMSQWYPRMGAYTDYEAWTAKEFLGSGEFTQEFGNFDVTLTVPADHVVAATGELQNMNDVMTAEQLERWEEAKTADRPVYIVTMEEAIENEKEGTNDTKTWHYAAEDVRDFAWASSRKFAWDAKGYNQGGNVRPLVMAMSYFPKEGGELWEKYSTEVVIHTMEVYSRVSFEYPYPVAISVNGPVGGMEYPMITFNGPRTILNDDGTRTYTMAEKEFLIGVVIHEVGHFYFPMIVNSDERQWTWMDEGLNTFLQFLAEREWEDDYPSRRGDPANITGYMLSQNQVPIMTNSESILQFGNNAYAKPATALTILRETVMGRELFDFAFKEYSERWMFKRPTPSDLFHTMEDASAVDLDWFWRGWFYTTDHVDIALTDVREYTISTQDPEIEFPIQRQEEAEEPVSLTQLRNADLPKRVEEFPELEDLYNENDEFTVSNVDRNEYTSFRESLEDWELELLDQSIADGLMIYFIDFENIGGLVMPLPLRIEYANGGIEDILLPAEIWRRSPHQITRMFISEQAIVAVELDPIQQIADTDRNNNRIPQQIQRSRIELYRSNNPTRDLMADLLVELEEAETGEGADTGNDVPLQATGE